MMSNIFSIFDPTTDLNFSMNWLSPIIIFLVTPFTFWFLPARVTFSYMLLMNFIYKEIKILIKHPYSNLIIFISLFWMILLNNLMGLAPHIFPPTSHLSFNFSIALPLWLAMTLYSLINYFNDLCSHLTPHGTPRPLMPFMVIIESISLIIRPITLSVRLAANMIAGHLLLSLTGSAGPLSPPFSFLLTLPPQMLLFTLELAVTVIQAYVFSVLTTLYSSEA